VFGSCRGSRVQGGSESREVQRIRGPSTLELDARDAALHFGHQDGGELVRKLYGHPDARLARERVREAFRLAPAAPVPLVAATALSQIRWVQ
jgi:hypothetical protein